MKFRRNRWWMNLRELAGHLAGEIAWLAIFDSFMGDFRVKDKFIRLGPREQQIVELLLQGCENSEIARQLKMARRTVKAHFNRLFLRFGISGGIKRVKLATLLYRRQLCSEVSAMGTVSPVNVNTESSSSLPKA